MRLLVQKFGGTSLDSVEHRASAARKVLQARESGFSPVVVVSAMGRSGAPWATDTLAAALREVDPQVAPNLREMDMLMACGETISAAIFAQTLQAAGCRAAAMTGAQAGIFTDGRYGNSRIVQVLPEAVLDYVNAGYVPVICGFQGVTRSEASGCAEVTTLGRGGSDTTAAAVGAAIKAESVEIYTDVDGIKSADPDIVPAAITLPVCTYTEVAEIAHQGARVVHPRAAEIARDYGIPLRVKSTFSDEPGTLVVGDGPVETGRLRVSGIAHTGKIVHLSFELSSPDHRAAVERHLYRIMARAGVNIFLVAFAPESISFAVPRERYPEVRSLLDGMLVPVISGSEAPVLHIVEFVNDLHPVYSVQRPLLAVLEASASIVDVQVTVTENCSMVSVVAPGHRREAGLLFRVLKYLNSAGIAVYQTADSEMSVSFLVPEAEVDRAVRGLHEQLVGDQENFAVAR